MMFDLPREVWESVVEAIAAAYSEGLMDIDCQPFLRAARDAGIETPSWVPHGDRIEPVERTEPKE